MGTLVLGQLCFRVHITIETLQSCNQQRTEHWTRYLLRNDFSYKHIFPPFHLWNNFNTSQARTNREQVERKPNNFFQIVFYQFLNEKPAQKLPSIEASLFPKTVKSWQNITHFMSNTKSIIKRMPYFFLQNPYGPQSAAHLGYNTHDSINKRETERRAGSKHQLFFSKKIKATLILFH